MVAATREVADIRDRIAVEDHEIGIKTLLDPALLLGLEIARGIGGERGQHLTLRKGAAHQLVFQRSVVELRVADVGTEQDRPAIVREELELTQCRSSITSWTLESYSGNRAFRRPSIISFEFDWPPRAIHADIVKAGSSSTRLAAASRASASRPRWAKADARQR